MQVLAEEIRRVAGENIIVLGTLFKNKSQGPGRFQFHEDLDSFCAFEKKVAFSRRPAKKPRRNRRVFLTQRNRLWPFRSAVCEVYAREITREGAAGGVKRAAKDGFSKNKLKVEAAFRLFPNGLPDLDEAR